MKHYIKIDLTNMKHDIKVLFELVYLNSEIKKRISSHDAKPFVFSYILVR